MLDGEQSAQSVYECCLTLGLSSDVRQKAASILTQTNESNGVGDKYSSAERIGGAVYAAALLCNETAGLQNVAAATGTNVRRVQSCADEQFRMVGLR